MTSLSRAVICAACLVTATTASATTWYVKPDGTGTAPTIQAAVDSSEPADTILLASGTFSGPGNCDIVVQQDIVITSELGRDSTIIDCDSLGRAFTFGTQAAFASTAEFRAVVRARARRTRLTPMRAAAVSYPTLSGVTIREASASVFGAVWVYEYGVTITDCALVGNAGHAIAGGYSQLVLTGNLLSNNGGEGIIGGDAIITATGNTVSDNGDVGIEYFLTDGTISGNTITGNDHQGLYIDAASPEISNNTISGNSDSGIYVTFSSPMITDNLITDNTATFGGGVQVSSYATLTGNIISGNTAQFGGGVAVGSGAILINNTIADNTGVTGSAIYASPYASLSVENSIIAFNHPGETIVCDSAMTVLSCNDIYGNAGGNAVCGVDGGGNISSNPMFCDQSGHNYALNGASRCVPQNNTCGVQLGAVGVACNGRPAKQGVNREIRTSWRTLERGAPGGRAMPVLGAASPNPFNPVTRIRYALPEETRVSLDIYDASGRLVERLVTGRIAAGEHEAVWRATGQPSGVYFYRLRAGRAVETRKIILLK